MGSTQRYLGSQIGHHLARFRHPSSHKNWTKRIENIRRYFDDVQYIMRNRYKCFVFLHQLPYWNVYCNGRQPSCCNFCFKPVDYRIVGLSAECRAINSTRLKSFSSSLIADAQTNVLFGESVIRANRTMQMFSDI